MITVAITLLAVAGGLASFAAGIRWERRHWRDLMRERDQVAEAFLTGLAGLQKEMIRQVQIHGGAPWLN
jgi:hypothetical protein